MTDNTPTTKQEEGELGALEGAMQYGKERLFKWRHKDPASVPKELRCICELIHAVERLSAPAIPPHNEDGLRKALERLRPPLSVDAFNEVSAGKADFMAMILRADGEGCQDILAQQMQDQAARDIVEIINAVPALLQALGDIPSG